MDLRIEKILNKERKLQFWQIFAVAATLLEEFLAHWHFSSDFAQCGANFGTITSKKKKLTLILMQILSLLSNTFILDFFRFVLPKMSRVT